MEEDDSSAFIKSHHPEFLTMDLHTLRRSMYNHMYECVLKLQAMKIREETDEWWDADKVLEFLQPILEDYGWEGVGR